LKKKDGHSQHSGWGKREEIFRYAKGEKKTSGGQEGKGKKELKIVEGA